MAFGLEAEASQSKTKSEEESSTKSYGTKTGVQVNSGSVDVSSTINSGRTDTSSGETYNSGRTDLNYNSQTTINSGRTDTTVNSGRVDTGSATTTNSGSTNTSHTAARTNTVDTSSSTFNSGRTDTQQVLLSETAVNRLIQQMMEGTSGLQAVLSGQRQSGGYNSTAGTLLTSDLAARVAGEVAVRGAITETKIGSSYSNTSGRQVENIGAIDTTQVIGGSTSTQDYRNVIGESSSTATIGKSTNSVSGMSSNVIGESYGASRGTNTIGESRSDSTVNRGGSRTDIFETEAKQVDSKSKKESTTTNVSVKSKVSIVCTELNRTGKLPYAIYILSSKEFQTYPEHVLAGYYFWAVPVLTKLRKNPKSLHAKFYTWLLNSRCRGTVGSLPKYPTTWYDKPVAKVTYGICWLLGKTVARNFNFTDAMHAKLLKGN